MKFQFSNVVVVEEIMIGVVVKSWADNTHEVYVRDYNAVKTYKEDEMKHLIYSKELTEEEEGFYE